MPPSIEEMKMLMGISEALGKLDGQFEGQEKINEKQSATNKELYDKVNAMEKKEVRISTKMMVIWGIVVIIAGKVLGINLFSMFGG